MRNDMKKTTGAALLKKKWKQINVRKKINEEKKIKPKRK